jgi:hypothetical protein
MPAKAGWISRVPGMLRTLRSSTEVWVDRPAIQTLFDISPRRAQQIVSTVGGERVGTSVVIRRENLILYLEHFDDGESAAEKRRQQKFAATLNRLQQERLDRPQVLVEMSKTMVRQLVRRDFGALPEGVTLEPGCITVRFSSHVEALEKLMALAICIGQSEQEFEKRVNPERKAG